jgi:hypothetical protein
MLAPYPETITLSVVWPGNRNIETRPPRIKPTPVGAPDTSGGVVLRCPTHVSSVNFGFAAWLYVMEFFSWRQSANRRQVGALAGLTPTPYQSGERHREQGIAKAGNRHVRAMAIEIAWAWLRFLPDSALARWYTTRFGHGSSRMRRIGIVALARKLLIELWRYLETGVVPEGAVLKG